MSVWYAFLNALGIRMFEMDFMKNALLAVLLLGPLFGLLSTMIVTGKMSFFSDALGHSGFTGIAIGVLCGAVQPIYFAVGLSVLFALLFSFVRSRTSQSADTIIGVFSSTAVALGIFIVTLGGRSFTKFNRYLIGDILSVSPQEIGLLALVLLAAMLACVSFLLFAAAKSLAAYYFAGAVAGVSYALGSMVPASILMRRWFRAHSGLAIGICSAGTGLATVVFSPLFTAIAESSGVDRAFLWTAAFCAAAAVLVFFLIRSDPAALGLEPWGKATPESTQERALHGLHPSRLRWTLLLLAVLLVSGIGATGFTHLMTLYMSEGMDAMRTAAAFSLCGLALMAGKCVCGALCDKLGSYRANYLLFGSFILGCTLCVLAPLKSEALMLASAVFLGFGGSLITVGVSIWAGDLSTPERYEKTLRLFQGAYGLGGIVLSFLPGAIADLAGGYAPAYAVFAVMLLYSLFMLQSTYRLAKV